MLGRGVYFAKSAQTSAGYTAGTVKCIFVAKVLAGVVVTGSNDINVPSNNADTTVDNTASPGVFVIYHDAQAYPEYLFTFN